MLFDKNILEEILLTVFRFSLSFFIALFFGVIFGVLVAIFDNIYGYVIGIVDFLRSIPAISLFSFFLLLFGIDTLSKVMFAAWVGFLVILFNSIISARHIIKKYSKFVKLNRVKYSFFLYKILFLGSLKYQFSGIKLGASLVLILVLVSEMFMGSNSGIGSLIIDYQLNYEIPKMYALILISGIIGYGINKLVSLFEKNIVFW